MTTVEDQTGEDPPRFVTRGVVSVSLASLFSDSGHEITTSLLPTFVVTVLHSSAGALGVIEGISDALLGVAQMICGPFANDIRARRDIACGGYIVTALATGAVGLAATVGQAGVLRAAAWIARGARSPARDALFASMADARTFGRAYGMERAGDNLGAVIGPLLAALLLSLVRVRDALYLAAVPGAFAAIAIIAAAKEARSSQPAKRGPTQQAASTPPPRPRGLQVRAALRSGLARPAIAIGLFNAETARPHC